MHRHLTSQPQKDIRARSDTAFRLQKRRGLQEITFVFTAFALSCTAANDELGDEARRFDDDLTPVAALPWPTVEIALPSCETPFGDFVLPEVSEPKGDILLRPSALLQPTGVKERFHVTIREVGKDSVDTEFFSTLKVDAGSNATVLQIDEVAFGQAAVTLRFDTPGIHTVRVSVADDSDTRFGSIAIAAYETQLPVFEMIVSEGNMQRMLEDAHERIKVPGTLVVNGEPYATSVRLHGGSSRDYPKKSFRFDLEDGLVLPDTHDHIILRGEWNDKTMLRNYLCLEAIRNTTWLHTPQSEPVHFRVNDRYYGLMWHQERIGGDFLRTRGLNHETASLYEADPESAQCASPGGDLGPLSTMDDYRCVYDEQKGELGYADLLDLIEGTLNLPDTEFEREINDIVRVNDLLAYYAVMAVLQNHDHLRKNYYLYRDPNAQDDRWTIFPWDLEITLGHLWTEEDDVLDERIFTDEPIDFGVCPGYCNVLLSRLLAVDTYNARFGEMVSLMAEAVLDSDFLDSRIENFLCRATPEILADERKRAANTEYMDRVLEIPAFADARGDFISRL